MLPLRRSLGLDAAAGVSGSPPYMRGSFGAPVSVRSARDRRWQSAASRAEMPPRIPDVPLNAPPRLSPRSLGFVALTRSAYQRRMVDIMGTILFQASLGLRRGIVPIISTIRRRNPLPAKSIHGSFSVPKIYLPLIFLICQISGIIFPRFSGIRVCAKKLLSHFAAM